MDGVAGLLITLEEGVIEEDVYALVSATTLVTMALTPVTTQMALEFYRWSREG